MEPAFLEEVRAHDGAVSRSGVEVWIGAEPTFTDRASLDPWWLGLAEGGDKQDRARALLEALAPRLAGPARLLRVHGRQYPGEPAPRFCLGARFSRRGAPGEGGPPDATGLDAPPANVPVPADGEAWLSVTPDPGVVEVNAAPAHDLATFGAWSEAVYAAAADARLSPVRYGYNGDASDSGGGGQLTLGGPTPERSPFFSHPQLLPRLVRYLNRHPSLSYAFAPECVGSAGQGPRADEGVRELFEELPLALARLATRGERATPDELWGALAPLLVDASGNSHRAELNIEKLWNPYFGARGRLGIVELRALRMPPAPERLTAIAGLFRAVAVRLAVAPYEEALVDWGGLLHERFGLPWFRERDLEAVLADLAAHGLAPGPLMRAELLAAPEPVASVDVGGAALELAPALAFWPLVGDVASQERSGARLVDSSSSRLQVLVRAPRDAGRVAADGWQVPLHRVGAAPDVLLGSVRYRSFQPSPGLHPALAATDPLVVEWERGGTVTRVEVHGWRPTGGAYDGLPASADEARRRRRERVVVTSGHLAAIRDGGATGLQLDLRWPTPFIDVTAAPPGVAVP